MDGVVGTPSEVLGIGDEQRVAVNLHSVARHGTSAHALSYLTVAAALRSGEADPQAVASGQASLGFLPHANRRAYAAQSGAVANQQTNVSSSAGLESNQVLPSALTVGGSNANGDGSNSVDSLQRTLHSSGASIVCKGYSGLNAIVQHVTSAQPVSRHELNHGYIGTVSGQRAARDQVRHITLVVDEGDAPNVSALVATRSPRHDNSVDSTDGLNGGLHIGRRRVVLN